MLAHGESLQTVQHSMVGWNQLVCGEDDEPSATGSFVSKTVAVVAK